MSVAIAAENRHVVIENVRPSLEGGRYPLKRIVGERLEVEADLFRDGHELIRAVVAWRAPGDAAWSEAPLECVEVGLDRWRGSFPLTVNARYRWTIEAWTDRFASWLADLTKRVAAGQPVAGEVAEGVRLIEAVARAATGRDQELARWSAVRLREAAADPAAALAIAAGPELADLMARRAEREGPTRYAPEQEVVVDRPRARCGAWYELFIRSQGRTPGTPAGFRDAEARLPDLAALGFDVLYLPPIHPIGTTKRKGKDNRLTAAPGDPGSCWGIGSPAGGHDAVEPALGTLADFDHFVAAARAHEMEIALDLAIQCSPDHPWIAQHPDWFYQRADGTIKFAENPPKKYEDIYPLNFDTPDWRALWAEWRRIVLFWVGHGVRIFRVDNPHTKPLTFWEWLIKDVQAAHPDVLFLAEAFTRPQPMKALAKAGFSQSYTYFTWRNAKAELGEYLTELTRSGMEEYFRPNFFANTPDILHAFLQQGGRPAFKIRLLLAATLSPAYGIYSGFELCENEAVPGTEEYLHSEKYEIKVRDWNRPGNIKEFVARVNRIRRENPALSLLTNLRFWPAENDQLLFYGKVTPDRTNALLVLVNLDPFRVQEGMVTVPLEELGLKPGGRYEVCDLLTGARYAWGDRNYVRLDPATEPGHVLRVERRLT
ncbi:MAG: alpha-1,4-glucan--maltose-1-phosphate maltosyltransferase [Planctomycetes bacterium]|nr:alpha-1,4-glucan--maltose-1-phosphate maltosyltransferase [Planctomycetota bacterium]